MTLHLLLSPSILPVLRCTVLPLPVTHWFCFDFLVYFLGLQSQASCLPSVRALLRNGRESWLEPCPGPHILAPPLECQRLSQSTKERWPDSRLQSFLGTRAGSVLTRRGCGGRTRLPENPAGTLGNGTCLCLLLSPRVRSWTGLSSVLGTEDVQSLCLQDIVAESCDLVVYRTRASVPSATSLLLPPLFTVGSSDLP